MLADINEVWVLFPSWMIQLLGKERVESGFRHLINLDLKKVASKEQGICRKGIRWKEADCPGWGPWLVRRCFPALLFYVGLRLPVFSRVSFLVSDLACLVCTVQIKVLSLRLELQKVT